MLWSDHIRRWHCVGLCGLLCLSVRAGVAQTASAADAGTSSGTSAKPSTKTQRPAAHAHRKHASSSPRSTKTVHGKKVASKRGQQGIDSARAREIQAALIRQDYMKGEPTGAWDSDTQDAMRRYQADHGWQSKTVPDSRALIRLGLGPSSDHLLNPESAMTAAPANDSKVGIQPASPQDLPKQ
jgi:peptidoglycan hydrolase-like protein with peptidoglycan-binding domain